MAENVTYINDLKTAMPLCRIHAEYVTYCNQQHVTIPVVKSHMGTCIAKMFPQSRPKRRKQLSVSEVCYEGLTLNTSEEVGSCTITVPDYCHISSDNARLQLEIPTMFMCDNKAVNFQYYIDIQDGKLSLLVNNVQVNVEQYGFKPAVNINQRTLDSLIFMYNCISLCKGRKLQQDIGKRSACVHKWDSMYQCQSNEEIRYHSNKCLAILKINSVTGKNCCEHCTRDLNNAVKYAEKKIQRSEAESSKDTETPCTEEEIDVPQDEYEFAPSVLLTNNDNEDFARIVEQIKDKAPNFHLLLKAQLLNARHKDPRQRKWDPAIISFCLHSWAQYLNSYRGLQGSKTLILPSRCTLQYHKNRVSQVCGIVPENFLWMYNEAERLHLTTANLKGGLILDEMSIQDDIQIVKRGQQWELVGAVDLGELVNSMEYVWSKKKEMTLASHCLQYLFVGFGGFCWPVAYYGTNNASAHQLYYTFWQIVKELYEYNFEVHYAMLDGSVMNRNFTNMMFPSDPKLYNFCAVNPFFPQQKLPIVQDIKHCLKKIRKAILSSSEKVNAHRCLVLHEKTILWDHFIQTYEFNNSYQLRPDIKITRNHIFPSQTDKMRNHLAEEVLNGTFLELMSKYQMTLTDSGSLNSTMELLENTAVLIDIFNNDHHSVDSVNDPRIEKLLKVLHFFTEWESEFEDPKDRNKHLMSREDQGRCCLDHCWFH